MELRRGMRMPSEKGKEVRLGEGSAGASPAKNKDLQTGRRLANAGVDPGDGGGVPSGGGGVPSGAGGGIPSLTCMNPATIKAGESSSITVTGSDFRRKGMTVILDRSAGITVGPVRYTSSTESKFDLTATSHAAPGTRSLKLRGPKGLSNTSLTLTVTRQGATRRLRVRGRPSRISSRS
jgi:hypothetical protein